MQAERIFIVVKRTKWERDRVRYGSARTARKIYSRQSNAQHNAYERVFQAHERQIRNLESLRNALPDARYVQREELPYLENGDYDLLISFGGDNHFVHVSHYLSSNRAILGLNSDPESSTGALLYFKPAEFFKKIPELLDSPPPTGAAQKNQQKESHKDALKNPSMQMEAWTRIGCDIETPEGQRKKLSPCVSEVTVRSTFHDYVSRYMIHKGEDAQGGQQKWEEHKNSGLLLACGAGSTGWYRNCQPLSQQAKAAFPKDANYFRTVAREVGSRARRKFEYIQTTVEENEVLSVVSEMDGEITVDADPERVFPFPPGSVAKFRLSGERLNVVRSI
ncbi:MAG: hypothetical protein NXI24_20560 [bacterium]|nr:hypothetical protein [bacterium]